MQNIGLILGVIHGAQEFLPPCLARALAGIMTSRQIICAEGNGLVEKNSPLDQPVAAHARIGRDTAPIFIQEELHNFLMKWFR